MIGALLGLYRSTLMAHNVSYGMFSSMSMSKSAQMTRTNDITMYKIASAQQDYYRKLLHKNIESSFNTFA